MGDVEQAAVEDILHIACLRGEKRMFRAGDGGAAVVEEKPPSRALWLMCRMDDGHIGWSMVQRIMGRVDHQIGVGKHFLECRDARHQP